MIMVSTLDKETVKIALKELMQEDSFEFQAFIKKIIEESINDDIEFEKLIKQNFKKFDATYRALA
jgi:hypothetical protein